MNLLTTILTNKYFYILLFLIILNTVVKFYNQFPYVKKDQDYDTFLHSLHNYYVQNLYYECFIVLLYFLSYFGIFLLLRLRLLGNELEVITLSLTNFNLSLIINIMLFILCIIFYIEIINTLFYPNLIKLHYYLYKYEWYENIIDKCHMNIQIMSEIMRSASSLFAKYTWSKEGFYRVLKLKQESDFIEYEDIDIRNAIHNKYIKQKKAYDIIHNHVILYWIAYSIAYCISIFGQVSRNIYYISYFLLILLVWEIHNGILYYMYYALFVYFITIWLRKVRIFLTFRDPLEKVIMEYFYNNEIPYLKIKALLENSDIINVYYNIGQDTKTLLNYKDELISYMLNNFIVYHVRYPTRKANEDYLNNDARRTNILILLFLGIVYYYVNTSKYSCILFGTAIKLYMLFIPLFILSYLISCKILYDTKETSEEAAIVWAEHKCYKTSFRIIMLVIAIPMLYIMLKNKLTVFPHEAILEIGHYIKVVEPFNIEQKTKYLEAYLEIILKVLNIPENKYKEELLQKIIINDDTTLESIRNSINDTLFEKFSKDALKEPLTLFELGHNWWKKLKTILFR